MKRTGSDGRRAAAQARQGRSNGLEQSLKTILFFKKIIFCCFLIIALQFYQPWRQCQWLADSLGSEIFKIKDPRSWLWLLARHISMMNSNNLCLAQIWISAKEHSKTCQQLGQPAYSWRQPERRSEETENTFKICCLNIFPFDNYHILYSNHIQLRWMIALKPFEYCPFDDNPWQWPSDLTLCAKWSRMQSFYKISLFFSHLGYVLWFTLQHLLHLI